MSNQTNKKSPQDRGDNEEKDINMSLRSIWLGLRNDYRTLLDIQEPVNSALGFEKTGKLHKRVDQ